VLLLAAAAAALRRDKCIVEKSEKYIKTAIEYIEYIKHDAFHLKSMTQNSHLLQYFA
jgi:hypothetical protein